MNDKFKKKLDFWENQAGLFKESQLATAPDIYYRDLEIKSILEYLPKGERKRVLDIGCGNGYSTFIFAKESALNTSQIKKTKDAKVITRATKNGAQTKTIAASIKNTARKNFGRTISFKLR